MKQDHPFVLFHRGQLDNACLFIQIYFFPVDIFHHIISSEEDKVINKPMDYFKRFRYIRTIEANNLTDKKRGKL